MYDIEPGSGLDQAADKLFAAVYEYREYVKRHHRERLAGVMWIRKAHKLIAFRESGKYTEQVCWLTHDAVGDSFSLSEVKGV